MLKHNDYFINIEEQASEMGRVMNPFISLPTTGMCLMLIQEGLHKLAYTYIK